LKFLSEISATVTTYSQKKGPVAFTWPHDINAYQIARRTQKRRGVGSSTHLKDGAEGAVAAVIRHLVTLNLMARQRMLTNHRIIKKQASKQARLSSELARSAEERRAAAV
jgi:hypothetical protein